MWISCDLNAKWPMLLQPYSEENKSFIKVCSIKKKASLSKQRKAKGHICPAASLYNFQVCFTTSYVLDSFFAAVFLVLPIFV